MSTVNRRYQIYNKNKHQEGRMAMNDKIKVIIGDESKEFFNELVKYHVSGQLKVAPEHCSSAVLDKMGKPHIETYKRFQD